MGDRVEELQSRLCDLALRVQQLEGRVQRLESRRRGVEELELAAAQESPALPAALPQGTLALLGRTLLVLAGAYLVRALTDSHALPAAVGLGLGIAYAALWQLRADRDAGRQRAESAAFHDLASSIIAFPLVWEATARFGLLPAAAGCLALVSFFALGLAVAWHRRLVANAIVTTLLALATTVALLVANHDLLPAMLALLAIAAGLEWLAFKGAFLGLRWLAAAVLNAIAFLMVAVVTRPELPEGYVPLGAGVAAAVLLAIPALYVTSVAARTLRLGQPVTAFEVAQGSAAVLLGFGGATRVLSAHGMPALAPGVLALLLGLLCYGAAFAYAERRPGQGRNFYFYSTAGGLLTLAGTSLVGLGPSLAVAWSAAGLLAAGLGRRYDRMTLRVHGALYLVAAALHTGLLVGCVGSLGGEANETLTALSWVVALAAAGAWVVLATDPAAGAGLRRTPQLLLAVVVVLAVGKAVQLGMWTALGRTLAEDPAGAAVARTFVLAALALSLAGAAGRRTLPELGWLVYPLVALGGMKLLVQDLRQGRPATLVMSLALYGLVLTLAPRLMRSRAADRG